jgi:hypothetical protein
MKILVACEESQRVTIELRKLGHEAFSCDIQDCSGGQPEWHIKGDAVEQAYLFKWDMMIAHPPCTYLSKAGARWLYPKKKLNIERLKKGFEAKAFFDALKNAPINKICIENPKPQEVYNIEKYDQVIQPYEYGHTVQKATCLWLKNLPRLTPTNIVDKGSFVRFPGTGHRHNEWFMKSNAKERSKTFTGIAEAMSKQWT